MSISSQPPDPDQLSSFTVAELRRGFVAALPFVLSNGTAGAVMGLTYKGLGLNFAQAVSFSAVVYSATAQAIVVSLWKLPLPVVAMVVACAATNARYLIMGAHLRKMYGVLRQRHILPTLFLLADASWLMVTADSARNRPDAGYLLGTSLPMAIGWDSAGQGGGDAADHLHRHAASQSVEGIPDGRPLDGFGTHRTALRTFPRRQLVDVDRRGLRDLGQRSAERRCVTATS
jgi:hypothetical protein